MPDLTRSVNLDFIKKIAQLKRSLVVFVACAFPLITFSNTVQAADPNKVIHAAFPAADDGFDMVRTANYYSAIIAGSIQETLLTYDYLARPAKLVPGTAAEMPEVSDGGKVYVFHLQKGIYFAADPAFKGSRRELTAQDYAYTFKRFLDPKNHSPAASFLSGKILGMDEVVAKASKTGKFDYDAPVAGLETPDRYTLKITLKTADYNFLYVIAYSGFGAVAREVVEMYGDQIAQHPVGTGPYMLQKYLPRSKIVLVANPDFRKMTWDFKSTGDAWDSQLVKDMQGKTLPQVGRVEVDVIEEEQSRWLAFQSKQLDIAGLPPSLTPTAMSHGILKPDFTKQGIKLFSSTEPEVTYTILNQRDPIVGGNSLAKIALRRAIIMSYNTQDDLNILQMGQAVKAQMIIPAGVTGHDPSYRSSVRYDIGLANQLLDHFGYKRGADGYRTLPNGKPLLLKVTTEADSKSQIRSEIWKHGLDDIGIRVEFPVSSFADNLKAATECKLMMWGGAWIADYPEGENFMQLLYGPNAKQGNHGCYSSPVFDGLYVKAKSLPAGEERNQLYMQMNRQVEADGAWLLGMSRVSNSLIRPWVKGYKRHPILASIWMYLDVEKH